MKYRTVYSWEKHICDTCHQEILPGQLLWQEFDKHGFWIGIECVQCHRSEDEALQKAQET